MNREFQITPTKTYSNLENARRAVTKSGDQGYRHFYMTNDEGRTFPVFVGQDAVQAGIHFRWNVVG